MRVLLAEDDELLGDSVKAAIAAEGYAVDWIVDGSAALAVLLSVDYDLAILDIRLPNSSGLDIVRSIRKAGMDTPVLLLTARNTVEDKVCGLDAGADDYLTKPFDLDELFARIRCLLRRVGSKSPLLKAGALEMNLASRQVCFHGQQISDLTAKELGILEKLLRNRGKFVTKSKLFESSSSWDDEVESNTIEVYISRLRKRFGHGAIETLRGVGYRLM